MMKIERPDAPQWLTDNWERWGTQYKQKRDDPNKSNDFTWYKHNGQSVRELILPLLVKMTERHCSFCDCLLRRETIEHFKPKSDYPLESYSWENLFVCCFDCQARYSDYEETLLKPDELDYEFSRYFIYNFTTGELEPNKQSSLFDQQRAKDTIRLYKLNEFGLPEARLTWSNMMMALQSENISKLPYRFIFV